MPLNVHVTDSLLNKFFNRAKLRFPSEHAEVIYGKRKGNVIYITKLADIEYDANSSVLTFPRSFIKEHTELAKKQNLILLGTVHTHTNTIECAASETDFLDARLSKEIVFGICSIWKTDKGKFSHRFNFWDPNCLVNIKTDSAYCYKLVEFVGKV